MNLELKIKELNDLSNALAKFSGKQKPALLFAISQNREKMMKPMTDLQKQYEGAKPDEFLEFERKREELYGKYRQELGLTNDSYDFGDKAFEVEQAVIELAKEYDEPIKEYDDNMKEFDAFLEEDIDINLQPIKMASLPDTMSIYDLKSLKPILKDIFNWKKHQLKKISMTRNDVFAIVNFISSPEQVGVQWNTTITERLACFIDIAKDEIEEIYNLRKTHSKIPEFLEHQQKREAILYDMALDEPARINALQKLISGAPKKVTKIIQECEQEMLDLSNEVVELEIPFILIRHFTDDIDESVFQRLVPLINGDEG